MTSTGALILYGAGIAAVGLPPAWLTFTECQREMDPAPLAGAKRHVATAIVWDLLLAYTAGGAVFGAQRLAGFDITGRLAEASGSGQQGLLVGVVALLAGGTGLAARTVGRRVAKKTVRANGIINAQRVVVSARINPKIRALTRLGSMRTEWMTCYAEDAAEDVARLGAAEVMASVELFMRTRSVSGLLNARAGGLPDPVDLATMRHDMTTLMGEDSTPLSKRVEVLLVLLLENDGKDRVDRLAERGRTLVTDPAEPPSR